MSFILPERGEFSEEAEKCSVRYYQKTHPGTVWAETRGRLEVTAITQMKGEGFNKDHCGWDGKRMDLRISWKASLMGTSQSLDGRSGGMEGEDGQFLEPEQQESNGAKSLEMS